MVKINDSHALLTGGTSNDEILISMKTFFFDFETKLWSPGPDLERPRESHACGMVKKDKNSEKVLLCGGVFEK